MSKDTIYRQRIPESSCVRKETVNIEILVTSRNQALSGEACYHMCMCPHTRKGIQKHVKLHAQIKLLTTRFSYIIAFVIKIIVILMWLLSRRLPSIIKLKLCSDSVILQFILKAVDSTLTSKGFSSQSSLEACKRYICIYKQQKEHRLKKSINT